MNYYIITYGFIIISLLITGGANAFINSAYKQYARVKNKKKISGAEVAREILNKNGLKDIYVVETSGTLTDHYDPARKVIRLSSDIFNGESISAVSVAAHECGHAIQDKVGYTLMKVRSSIVPIVNFSTKIGYVILFIGVIASISDLIWTGIILEAAISVFQLITLPVEVDASKRALRELENLNLVTSEELPKCKTVLSAAALTYVAGVLTAILEILRLILIYGRNDRD